MLDSKLISSFSDRKRALELLADLEKTGLFPDNSISLLNSISKAASPDQALLALDRIAHALTDPPQVGEAKDGPDFNPGKTQGNTREFLTQALKTDNQFQGKLIAILGASQALADELVRRPELLFELKRPGLGVASAEIDSELSVVVDAALKNSDGTDTEYPPEAIAAAVVALRRAYRAVLLRIVGDDLIADPIAVLPEVSLALANLAGAAFKAAVSIANAEVAGSELVDFAVIGMGKVGARELNYISDVDVMYVAEPRASSGEQEAIDEAAAIQIATKMATSIGKTLSGYGVEAPLWEVDTGLRPEGKQGPLVRTVASYRAYYEKWAKNWEFQALLKSRAIAGDQELGKQFRDAVRPLVWQATTREDFVAETQAMRRRVEANIKRAERDRQIKLGKGGLRDVEFTVQLLQLVHGRTDESVRRRNTLSTLESLGVAGYLGRDDAAELDASYRFLRALEHRMQLVNLKRVQLLPTSEIELRRLGRVLGSKAIERDAGQRSAEALVEKLRGVRLRVRELHENLYYRPLLPAYAKLADSAIALTPEAQRDRLAAIGYQDTDGALKHIAALTEGPSRRAALQRQLLPVLLQWIGETFNPDLGLLAFRRLSDEVGTAHWYLKLLRDSGTAARSLTHLLGTSKFLGDAVALAPEAVQWLAEPSRANASEPLSLPNHDERATGMKPLDWERLSGEADAILTRAEESQQAVTSIRALRRRELARIAAGEVLGEIDRVTAARAISDLADLALLSALRVAQTTTRERLGIAADPAQMLIVAMGRYGGQEMGYGSDADVMFVYNPMPGVDTALAANYAKEVATIVKESLSSVGSEPPLQVDADLRPEGKNGPLVRSIDSYREYYERWMEVWEAQALLRARPLSGLGIPSLLDVETKPDLPNLGEQFLTIINKYRYPEGGLTNAQLNEIRRIKARLEAERLPRGVDPVRHLKLGPGGIADVEWVAQILQLQHGFEVRELRTTATLPALVAARSQGLISELDETTLETAWTKASQLRAAVVLATGKLSGIQGDVLPQNTRDLAGLAAVLAGMPDHSQELPEQKTTGQQIAEDYLRAARRARKVFERLVYKQS